MVFSLLAFVLFAVPVLAGSQDLSMKLKSGQYVQNANNFYIIFDKSSSMGNPYAFLEKLIIEKNWSATSTGLFPISVLAPH